MINLDELNTIHKKHKKHKKRRTTDIDNVFDENTKICFECKKKQRKHKHDIDLCTAEKISPIKDKKKKHKRKRKKHGHFDLTTVEEISHRKKKKQERNDEEEQIMDTNKRGETVKYSHCLDTSLNTTDEISCKRKRKKKHNKFDATEEISYKRKKKKHKRSVEEKETEKLNKVCETVDSDYCLDRSLNTAEIAIAEDVLHKKKKKNKHDNFDLNVIEEISHKRKKKKHKQSIKEKDMNKGYTTVDSNHWSLNSTETTTEEILQTKENCTTEDLTNKQQVDKEIMKTNKRYETTDSDYCLDRSLNIAETASEETLHKRKKKKRHKHDNIDLISIEKIPQKRKKKKYNKYDIMPTEEISKKKKKHKQNIKEEEITETNKEHETIMPTEEISKKKKKHKQNIKEEEITETNKEDETVDSDFCLDRSLKTIGTMTEEISQTKEKCTSKNLTDEESIKEKEIMKTNQKEFEAVNSDSCLDKSLNTIETTSEEIMHKSKDKKHDNLDLIGTEMILHNKRKKKRHEQCIEEKEITKTNKRCKIVDFDCYLDNSLNTIETTEELLQTKETYRSWNLTAEQNTKENEIIETNKRSETGDPDYLDRSLNATEEVLSTKENYQHKNLINKQCIKKKEVMKTNRIYKTSNSIHSLDRSLTTTESPTDDVLQTKKKCSSKNLSDEQSVEEKEITKTNKICHTVDSDRHLMIYLDRLNTTDTVTEESLQTKVQCRHKNSTDKQNIKEKETLKTNNRCKTVNSDQSLSSSLDNTEITKDKCGSKNLTSKQSIEENKIRKLNKTHETIDSDHHLMICLNRLANTTETTTEEILQTKEKYRSNLTDEQSDRKKEMMRNDKCKTLDPDRNLVICLDRLTDTTETTIDETLQTKEKCKLKNSTKKQRIKEREIMKTNKRCKSVDPDYSIDESLNIFEDNSSVSDSSSEELEEEDFYDFIEEKLNFEPPLLHFKGHCVALTPEQKNQIKELGITVQKGKWSEKEDEILKRNWENFIKKHKLKKPHLLLGLQTKKDPTVIRYAQDKKFYFQLGKDLNDRPLHSVYLRARKLFDPYNDKEETTSELLEEIMRLQAIHGNKWSVIGKILKRSALSISEIVRWHRKKEKALGSWSEEEDKNLIKAIKKVLQVKDIVRVDQGIPWEKVAKLVPSRNAKQCRAHWMLHLCWTINNPNDPREKWNDVHTVRLINYIYNLSAEREEDIDWIDLFNKFTNVASYSYVHAKWASIKREVPKCEEQCFEDIVLYLYNVYLPTLVAKLGKSDVDEVLESS